MTLREAYALEVFEGRQARDEGRTWTATQHIRNASRIAAQAKRQGITL